MHRPSASQRVTAGLYEGMLVIEIMPLLKWACPSSHRIAKRSRYGSPVPRKTLGFWLASETLKRSNYGMSRETY